MKAILLALAVSVLVLGLIWAAATWPQEHEAASPMYAERDNAIELGNRDQRPRYPRMTPNMTFPYDPGK